MKKLLAILLVFAMCIGLCACGGNEGNPTQEELEEMYQQAKEYENNAKFDEAIKLYRTIFIHNFSDPDYSDKTPEEVLEIKEHNFILQTIACKYFEYAIWLFNDEIVERLKDPDSLKIYGLTIEEDEANSDRFYVVFDYGAANSFGGMVRDSFEAPYILEDDEIKLIYGCMDSSNRTAAEYLVGNYYWRTIYSDTQKEAIISGTATYRGSEPKEYETESSGTENAIPEYTTIPAEQICLTVAATPTISTGRVHTVAMQADGTLVAVGSNLYGQCDISDWTDISAVYAGECCTIGLKTDGTVVAKGSDGNGVCDVSSWTDIVGIATGNFLTVGLKADGTVVATKFTGNQEMNHGQWNVSGWTDIVAVDTGWFHTVGLKSDGTVVATEFTGDQKYNKGQCDVSDWTDIVAIAAGDYCTIGLKSDGTVVTAGNNSNGECDVSDWTDIVAIDAGRFHTVGLKSDGSVVATGANSDGQCDVSAWTDIVAITVDSAQTLGLKADGTVVAVGDDDLEQCSVTNWKSIKLPS